MNKMMLVTGGAGFIGSSFVELAIKSGFSVINLDKLTYSGSLENLSNVLPNKNHIFVRGDIGNEELVSMLLDKYKPCCVINFAAETHVDRSILDPFDFVKTNIMCTSVLLSTCLNYWNKIKENKQRSFRFVHISTDEVFGSLDQFQPSFTEKSSYSPNSPYSASKASSDHFVRSYFSTYGFPSIITNCSNNYGPRQYPEKLIPLMVLNGISKKKLPIYGNGTNVRDWLHVEDHCNALLRILSRGRIGENYNIGGDSERTNMQVVQSVCDVLDELLPLHNGKYSESIEYIQDRPGHDFRYSVNCDKIKGELGWSQKISFEKGLYETVRWYINNLPWVSNRQNEEYSKWLSRQYKAN